MSRTEPPPPQHKRLAGLLRSPTGRAESVFIGIPVSAGVAIGPVFSAVEPQPQITRHKVAAADTGSENARLDAAISQSRKQLTKLRARLGVLPDDSQEEIAPLIDAYLRMLEFLPADPRRAGAHPGDAAVGGKRGRRGIRVDR